MIKIQRQKFMREWEINQVYARKGLLFALPCALFAFDFYYTTKIVELNQFDWFNQPSTSSSSSTCREWTHSSQYSVKFRGHSLIEFLFRMPHSTAQYKYVRIENYNASNIYICVWQPKVKKNAAFDWLLVNRIAIIATANVYSSLLAVLLLQKISQFRISFAVLRVSRCKLEFSSCIHSLLHIDIHIHTYACATNSILKLDFFGQFIRKSKQIT